MEAFAITSGSVANTTVTALSNISVSAISIVGWRMELVHLSRILCSASGVSGTRAKVVESSVHAVIQVDLLAMLLTGRINVSIRKSWIASPCGLVNTEDLLDLIQVGIDRIAEKIQ